MSRLVAGFDDLAVMSEAVQERGGHLGVTEGGGPFAEWLGRSTMGLRLRPPINVVGGKRSDALRRGTRSKVARRPPGRTTQNRHLNDFRQAENGQ